MSEANVEQDPLYFVDSLRQYVLSPLSTAERIVDQERTAVVNELNALKEFQKRLASIEPSRSTATDYTTRLKHRNESLDKIAQVRTAFRETVLGTPYYDEHERDLVDHFAEELGEDLAYGVRERSSMSFTEPYKNALTMETGQAIQERQEFLEIIDGEAQSIEHARSSLTDILSAIDTTIIPDWHCESFTDQLNAVAERRQ